MQDVTQRAINRIKVVVGAALQEVDNRGEDREVNMEKVLEHLVEASDLLRAVFPDERPDLLRVVFPDERPEGS